MKKMKLLKECLAVGVHTKDIVFNDGETLITKDGKYGCIYDASAEDSDEREPWENHYEIEVKGEHDVILHTEFDYSISDEMLAIILT